MVFKAILRPPLCEVYLAYTLYTHYLYTRHSLTHTLIHSFILSTNTYCQPTFCQALFWGERIKWCSTVEKTPRPLRSVLISLFTEEKTKLKVLKWMLPRLHASVSEGGKILFFFFFWGISLWGFFFYLTISFFLTSLMEYNCFTMVC